MCQWIEYNLNTLHYYRQEHFAVLTQTDQVLAKDFNKTVNGQANSKAGSNVLSV